MAEHEFNLLNHICVGCGIAAKDVADQPKLATACPAFYARLHDRGTELRLVIRPEDESITCWHSDGMPKFTLDQIAMFELRDAIDEGVRKIREAKGG